MLVLKIIWVVSIICTIVALVKAWAVTFNKEKPTNEYDKLLEKYESTKWIAIAFVFLTVSWMIVGWL